jgi:hypothetical protein
MKTIPAENILFASEIVGAVKGVDPETGHNYDDTKRYIDAVKWLPAGDRAKVLGQNALACTRESTRIGPGGQAHPGKLHRKGKPKWPSDCGSSSASARSTPGS